MTGMKDKFILKKKFSLQNRIFFSLIFLSIISSILISAVSVYQFKEEARTYHQFRLERKESSITENINYVLTTTPYELTEDNLLLIFKDRIHEIASIHNTEINIMDLDGKLILSSRGTFSIDSIQTNIPPIILKTIKSSPIKRVIDVEEIDDARIRIVYKYLKDLQFKPLGILKIPYPEETEFYDSEVQNFIYKFGQVYLIMLIMSIVISYFLSNYITQSLNQLSIKITSTKLGQKNEKIENIPTSKEISSLIEAYNDMVEKLDESYLKLAQTEREQAWREMAKQVAHEIKNPLTPMRLTVQSFERRFDPNDPDIKNKVKEYSEVLIGQIDTMSSIASAFSSFASMPAQQNERINVVKAIKLSLEIFTEDFIRFQPIEEELFTTIDKTQLIRIITNLVKNAIQAIPSNKLNPEVNVKVYKHHSNIVIAISDNGTGVTIADKSRIFEPKFTTKSSGMGLGLGIIKNIVENYNGTINFETEEGRGTTFFVTLPIT